MKWASRKLEGIFYSNIGIAILLIIVAIAFVLLVLALAQTPRRTNAYDWVNLRTATRQAPTTLHLNVPTTRESVPVAKVLLMEVSAYSPAVQECDATPLITASGKRVYVGGVAACLRQFPFGTILLIPNYNNGKPCTVVDTGSAIVKNCLDVFMWSEADARQWGRRRNVRVQVLYVPKVAE